ncbi:MAG: lytic transglycosylase domain-containing protein [Kiritimatiellia bacterium]
MAEVSSMRKALKQLEYNILVGMLLAAAFSLVFVWQGRPPEEAVLEPQIYFSDWLSDMAPLEDWWHVAGTHVGIVTWLQRVFAREGVPGELVWLAAVESGFDPAATSKRGAVGLFQLMPDTAQRYGLRVRNPDERLQPMRNAQAAARYLSDLYGRFGDWSLVLAAYNAGENRVARLTRMRGMDYESIAAWLPSETRSFVPRVRAVLEYQESRSLHEVRAPYRRYAGVLLVGDRPDP